MNIFIKYGTENIDWLALCEIFKLAPLGTREPEKLKIAAEIAIRSVPHMLNGKSLVLGGRFQIANINQPSMMQSYCLIFRIKA